MDSEDQHAVAVRIETVFLSNSLAVGFESEFASRDGRYEHDQSGFREVEIGQECVDCFEFIGRMDENIGFSGDFSDF